MSIRISVKGCWLTRNPTMPPPTITRICAGGVVLL